MGTFVQVLGFLLGCIPNHALSLHIFTDTLAAFLALLKCQSETTSLQPSRELLPVRTKLREAEWLLGDWIGAVTIYVPRSFHMSLGTGDPNSCLNKMTNYLTCFWSETDHRQNSGRQESTDSEFSKHTHLLLSLFLF